MSLEEAWREYREAKVAMEAAWRRYEELRLQSERRIRIPTGPALKQPRSKREKQPKPQPIPEWRIEDHIAS